MKVSSIFLILIREVKMMEKTDLASAYRRLKSPNIKTRKRALKIIKEYKRDKIRTYYATN